LHIVSWLDMFLFVCRPTVLSWTIQVVRPCLSTRLIDGSYSFLLLVSFSLDQLVSLVYSGSLWIWHYFEECCLLGYKNSVCTSQETHITTTEPSRLMLCKSWGFHGSDCEECGLFGYKNPVCSSRETDYISATELSWLMLCKIWGFHGGDYEECCLMGYKSPVHTSQKTRYVSATEPSQLMLCKIWGLHGGDYEECHLLGCDTMWLL
jgi:hypothetical protein